MSVNPWLCNVVPDGPVDLEWGKQELAASMGIEAGKMGSKR
jgi:hypothetical protein